MSVTFAARPKPVERHEEAYRRAFQQHLIASRSVDRGEAMFQMIQALRSITVVQGVEIQMLREQLERMERRP